MRLVYYSLTLPREAPRPDLVRQLEASLDSLRAHNTSVAVQLFVYGDVTRELAGIGARYGAAIQPRGSYEQRLAALAPRGWPALRLYPLLHKFLNFDALAMTPAEQILFLDCDTLFAGDVDRLFDKYRGAHCYAREEPTCGRSHYGYDPAYLDESALAAVAASEGVLGIPPFNLGVVLFNHRVWNPAAGLDRVLISYAWRFAVWMALNPLDAVSAQYGEGPGIQFLRDNFDRLVGWEDRQRALPYPSANRWILDQVALWLALGHLSGLQYADFAPEDVLQNGEFEHRDPRDRNWTLCHYYSQNLQRFERWVRNVR